MGFSAGKVAPPGFRKDRSYGDSVRDAPTGTLRGTLLRGLCEGRSYGDSARDAPTGTLR
eukprot:CAMPEP_0180222920 /NCGR_PEP_ID=MMETSP0987-20121128/21053_1 /TAXON_ID=697907 /ORGANISM="non described non described, Strain CCMP2293" /LENGTH=58 /DNA_ID=CAMNT_0022185211 /DNA_START=817 /DNA_END=989 /DNA_ORIENTATION=+